MENINTLIKLCPKYIDLTSKQHSTLITLIATKILDHYKSYSNIEKIEDYLINKKDHSLVFILTAIKIAKSKHIVNKYPKPIKIPIIIALYKEHNRIKTSQEHPHGEDFLNEKMHQINWLFKNNPNFSWEIILVDDGCPENSGKIAKDIIKENNWNDKVKVIFLQEAIENKLEIFKGLHSTKQSQKGGSIIYGLWHAITNSKDKNHILIYIYTDADTSTHLGQIGLLIDPILNKNKLVAIGSRREKKSMLIKKANRNDRGKMFIFIWKKLIPNLNYIIDSQCGFKAFKKEILTEILTKGQIIETKFAFDIELLLKSELISKNCIEKVAISWIDSDKSSTTTSLNPYLYMLKSIAKIYRKTIEPNPESDQFASFVENLNSQQFDKLLKNIPKEIQTKEPHKMQYDNSISAKDLLDIIEN